MSQIQFSWARLQNHRVTDHHKMLVPHIHDEDVILTHKFETVQISFCCFSYSGTDVCGTFGIDLKYLLFIFIREMYENISITFH